jgi:hypothetical protein
MSDLYIHNTAFPATDGETVEKIESLESRIREHAQIEFVTEHAFHAGMYARTVRIPAGVVFTTVLIKIPTLLVINGTCDVLCGRTGFRVTGYHVLSAVAPRKQVYITRSAVELTMIFPTQARTVEEAEAEFTDEGDSLLSRVNENDIVVTEAACLESQPQLHS